MIPLAIDPSRLRIGLAARGTAGLRRLGLLRAGGAMKIAVFCDEPDGEIRSAAPDTKPRLPGQSDIAELDVLWVAGISAAEAAPLAQLARDQRVLVNIEDVPELCDFHNVAELRRGDLLVTVSTGGCNPGLAAAVRKALERQFGPEWAQHLAAATDQRRAWREAGKDMPTVVALLERLVQTEGWLQ